MIVKAYIVANKRQELDILNKFEQKGLFWRIGKSATNFVPSENTSFYNFAKFPYALIENGVIIWSSMEQLENETIVYDGRKEEQMYKKYKVTQKFMDALNAWRDNEHIKPNSAKVNSYVSQTNLINLPYVVENWWVLGSKNPLENNNRLIAIIQWLNGEEVFEVETPRYIVRSDKKNQNGNYIYVKVENGVSNSYGRLRYATKFDTREEAQEWANSHQVVVEINEDGNEVE